MIHNNLLLCTIVLLSGINSIVAQTNRVHAVAAPLKMNVFYIGIDNPLDIAVAGVPVTDISARLTGAGNLIKLADGHYNARPSEPGLCRIVVSVKNKDVDTLDFRAKYMPAPTASIGGVIKSGVCNVGLLRAQAGIVARYDGFDYDVRYKINSFSVTCNRGSISNKLSTTGPLFTPEMKNMFGQLKKGDVVIVDDVIAVCPDSMPRRLQAIIITML